MKISYGLGSTLITSQSVSQDKFFYIERWKLYSLKSILKTYSKVKLRRRAWHAAGRPVEDANVEWRPGP